jgi:cytoskeletal protein CcmA (bactofilin family)
MKKFLAMSLLSIFAFLTFNVGSVSAKVMSSENGNITISKGDVIDDDLFIGAQTVNVDGVVNGDVFIGAQTVKITGTVNGNLHIGANTVDLGGVVKGNVYAGGQTILIKGAKVGGSVLVAGSTVDVDKDTTVGGSILTGAGSLLISAQVKRSIYAAAGSINIGKDAKVGKDFYYASDPNQAVVSDGAKIVGNTYISKVERSKEFDSEASKKKFDAFMYDFKIVSKAMSLLGALIVGFLYFKFFGKHFEESSNIVSGTLWKSLGVGFLVMVGFIPALFILIITVVGIPVAGLTFLMFILYSYLAKIVVGMALGAYLVKRFSWKMPYFLSFAVGLLTIYILKMVPVVGGFVTIFVYLTGLGALTLQTVSTKKIS